MKLIHIPAAIVVQNEFANGETAEIGRRQLDMVQARTLGETLSRVPGVQNSHFGPNAGAPVIRSMSGNRVRVLSNNLSVNDLSGISPSLNIHVDMDNLHGIDVYKSQASILYGGKAIGGAVNMRDNTIPVTTFPQKWQGRVVAEAGTNSGHRQAVDINGNLGKNWAWHIGGMNRQNGNLRIPGHTKAPIAYDPSISPGTAAMAQVHVDDENIHNISLYPYLSQYVLDNMNNPGADLSESDLYTLREYSFINGKDVRNPPNDKYIPGQDPNTPFYTRIVHGIYDYAPVTKGIMPNSHADSRSVNVGTSYVRNDFRIGLGYKALEGYYGIPGFAVIAMPEHSHNHSHDHSHGPAAPAEYQPINTRTLSHTMLFETEYKPAIPVVSNVKFNYMTQYADDRELLDIYRVNKFISNRHAFRAEIEQEIGVFWKGTNGVDFSFLKMDGDGVQRYLPNNLSREWGIFTSQQLDFRPFIVDLGYRHDWVSRRTLPDPTYRRSRGLSGGNLSERDFSLNHFAGSLRWNFLQAAFLKASYSHAERAPDVNELYTGNDHFAIMVEENGDDRLGKETAKSYEFGAGINYSGLYLTAAYYHTVLEDYLYLAHTGMARAGGFAVKEWRASDTKISGWEAELAYKSSWGEDTAWEIASFFDLVKNENIADDGMRQWAEGDFMPNMPTSRYGVSMAIFYRYR